MSILFCTGTLFSKWQELTTTIKSSNPSVCHENIDLFALANRICQQQHPELDELSRKPFHVDDHYLEDARRLMSDKLDESVLIWSANDICLNLDFWKDANNDAKFLLFFSSPEFDLSNYINEHPFDASQIDKVINAWVYRTRAMLTFFMNNRDQSILVSIQACGADHAVFKAVLDKLTELDLTITPRPTSTKGESSALIEYLATSLLLNNRQVSDLYDEARSAATLITEVDKSIPGIEDRNSALIPAFLAEISAHEQLVDSQSNLNDKLSISHLQINHVQEELEYYFNKSKVQEKKHIQQTEKFVNLETEILNLKYSCKTMSDYLSNDQLLKIAQQVRQTQ